MQRAQGGDEHAFRDLYRAVHPGLLRYLRVLVGDQDADDVASETWLQLVRDLGSFRGDDQAFRAWSARIGRNRALDHLRHHQRRPAVPAPAEELDRPGGADPADVAETTISTDAALALIASLPPDQAEAVMLRAVLGLDAVAAGKVLGKRAGAVRTAAHRGLKKLAELLDNGGESTGAAASVGPAARPADLAAATDGVTESTAAALKEMR